MSNCGEKIDTDNVEIECPFCGEDDWGDGFFRCENCDSLFDWQGDMWECPNCANEGKNDEVVMMPEICPECGAIMEDDFCEECGLPDVNQGWLGEEYG